MKTYELQAVSGISDIGPLTFGELFHAYKAKADFELKQTASLMARIYNCHRGQHQRAHTADNYYTPKLRPTRHRAVMPPERLHSLFGAFAQRA